MEIGAMSLDWCFGVNMAFISSSEVKNVHFMNRVKPGMEYIFYPFTRLNVIFMTKF